MKIILNILTHGDERIGLKVAKEIEKLNIDKNTLLINIANETAFKQNKRFIDQDLNRSFPGKKNGNHEERLAYKISSIVKLADIVIDIHSTKSDLRDAIIVTKFNSETKEFIESIQPKYVLIMNVTRDTALISQAKIGLAFEYGKDNDPMVLNKILKDLKKLFSHIGIIANKQKVIPRKTEYFNVYSQANKPKGYKLLKQIKNYRLVSRGQKYATNGKNFILAEDDFYPILFGEKNYKDIFGFMANKSI